MFGKVLRKVMKQMEIVANPWPALLYVEQPSCVGWFSLNSLLTSRLKMKIMWSESCKPFSSMGLTDKSNIDTHFDLLLLVDKNFSHLPSTLLFSRWHQTISCLLSATGNYFSWQITQCQCPFPFNANLIRPRPCISFGYHQECRFWTADTKCLLLFASDGNKLGVCTMSGKGFQGGKWARFPNGLVIACS